MTTDLERRLRETLERKHAEITGPMPPNDVPRRARRREARTIVLGTLLSLALVGALAATFVSLAGDGAAQRPATGDSAPLPSDVPAFDAQTPYVLARGTIDGQEWTLRVTGHEGEFVLELGWNGLGSTGVGLTAPSGQRLFGGYMTGSGFTYPNNDPTLEPLPNEVAGVARDDVAAVSLELGDGSVIDAQVVRLPDGLFGPASVFVLFVPADVLGGAGSLIAYDAAGAELGRQAFDLGPLHVPPSVLEGLSGEDLVVGRQLQLAGAIVGRYFEQHLSFSRLTPETASEISSDVVFNTSAVAVSGEVSLRVSGNGELVLAGATPAGDVYTVCFVDGSMNGLGRVDTSDPFACGGGWLDPNATAPPTTGDGAVARGSDEHGNFWTMSLLEYGQELELQLQIGAVGISKPLEPIGDAALGSIAPAPPIATANDISPEPTQPTAVFGLASGDVDRVEIRVDDGTIVAGALHPLEPNESGAEQAFIILVPTQGRMSGVVVAFDASGAQLGSLPISVDPADYA